MSKQSIPTLLTVKEAAHQLRVCERTVYRMLDNPGPMKLHATKVGQQWRIPSTSITAMFDHVMTGGG